MISLSLSTVPPSPAEALCGGGGHLGTYLPYSPSLKRQAVLKHQHAAEPPGGPVTAEGGNHTQGS